MPAPYVSDVAFTPSVKAEQARRGSRAGYARMAERGDWRRDIDADLAAFVAGLESFYLATASADGRPYIQHRGGPPGFLKVLDAHTLAFADFGGNRQYISVGNLAENDRVHLFLMDYAQARRVKIWARGRVVEDDPGLLARLAEPAYDATVERAFVFTVEAWDVNCRQHIPRKLDEGDVTHALHRLQRRIATLEGEIARLGGTVPA